MIEKKKREKKKKENRKRKYDGSRLAEGVGLLLLVKGKTISYFQLGPKIGLINFPSANHSFIHLSIYFLLLFTFLIKYFSPNLFRNSGNWAIE